MSTLKKSTESITKENLFSHIKILLQKARKSVVREVNTTIVKTYFEVGHIIVEHEQQGKERAMYNQKTLKKLSAQLTEEFGRGFSVTNLQQMKNFYILYAKQQTVSTIFQNNCTLSWSHYVFLMRLKEKERNFYEKEAQVNQWSLREMKRQFDSALFERIALSTDKESVMSDNLKKYHSPEKSRDIIKDPYVLEFLGLEHHQNYSENQLEQALIDNLEQFLLVNMKCIFRQKKSLKHR